MPIKRPELVKGGIYHIVLRGLEEIFKDESDYYRGIFSIYEFNNASPVVIRERRKARQREKAEANREQFSVDKRDQFIEILAFCFMPNHIHLLLRQIKDDRISKFMRKFGAGYATYFNKKYNRAGHLFQSRFRAVTIQTAEQLKNVFVYIHTNPISLKEPGWKEKGIKEVEGMIRFLENYKWSSYIDYFGKKNFPSVTKREFIIQTIGGEENCKEFVESWIKYKGDIRTLAEVVLE